MTTEKKYAKDLTAGEWIDWHGMTYIVHHVVTYGNGYVRLDLSDGMSVDALAYRTVPVR